MTDNRNVIEDYNGDLWYLSEDWCTDGKVFWHYDEHYNDNTYTWEEVISENIIEPCDRKKYERKLTEDKVINHVQVNARFMEDAPEMTAYVVRYPHSVMGKFYCASDPRELVVKIMKDQHPKAKL